jgi:hypothetical protein
MNQNTRTPKDVSPTIMAARSRLSAALQKQNELATASVSNPALEGDYQRAVAAVAAAEADLQEMTQ